MRQVESRREQSVTAMIIWNGAGRPAVAALWAHQAQLTMEITVGFFFFSAAVAVALLATLQQQTIDVQQLPLMAMPTTPRVLYGTSPPPKMLQLRQPRPRRLLIKIALTGQTSSYHCQLASSYVFVFPKKNIKARPYRPSNYSCT